MILLADLGNTRLKLATLDAHGGVEPRAALAHAEAGFESALADALDGLGAIASIWLASSAPSPLASQVQGLLQARAPLRRARVEDGIGGLRLAYREPQRLGVDRFLALLGARRRGVESGLVVLVGTAMTIDALAPGGRHLGGLILPSPQRMRAALHRDAPHLPESGGAVLDFAADTLDALQSGCSLAAQALVERSLARLASGPEPRLLIAGGGAGSVLDGLGARAESCPHLVLEGLSQWGMLRDGGAAHDAESDRTANEPGHTPGGASAAARGAERR